MIGVEYSVLSLQLAILILLIIKSADGDKQSWIEFWSNFYGSMVLLMATTSLISFWYIDKFSKVIEHLGVRTNSAVIKLYVITWIGLVITDIGLHTFRTLSYRVASETEKNKLQIVY